MSSHPDYIVMLYWLGGSTGLERLKTAPSTDMVVRFGKNGWFPAKAGLIEMAAAPGGALRSAS